MPTTILQPTVATTPDQGGTIAVTGAIATGHGSTLTGAGATDIESNPPENTSQSKSCRWSSFQSAPAGTITSLRLKFSWTASGSASAETIVAGTASGSASFVVQYTLNGGSNWTTVVNRSVSASASGGNSDSDSDPGASGNEDIALSTSQNVALVQVRDLVAANAGANAPSTTGAEASGSASYSTTVSAIQIEVVTDVQAQLLAMM